jgi:hypothetical protein
MPLCTVPPRPKHACLRDAHSILLRAVESAESFFDAFNEVRRARGAKGTPTDHEQDLLRAALMFATAGLDAMAKQLVEDALRVVIAKDVGANSQFREYVQGRLARSAAVDIKYLAHALVSDNPRTHLQGELIKELTGSSLQSNDQLFRVAAYFAIGADEISRDPTKLKAIFHARNQIAHEMDVLLSQANRSRRSRTYIVMREYTAIILVTAVALYVAVEAKM